MSSINLDLDFQDYTPTSSGRTTSKQPEAQVRIPLATESNTSKQNNQNAKSVINVLQNVANLQSGQLPGGLSDEAVQQLIRLSGIQKSKQQRASASAGGWGLGYFAQYFDVTTNDVLQRILWSAVPVRKTGPDLDELYDSELTAPLASNMASESVIDTEPTSSGSGDQMNSRLFEQLSSKKKHYSYIERFIQSRPDFYGPFWISTTLIFAIAIFSNIVSYINYRSKLYQADLISTGGHASTKNASDESLPDVNKPAQLEEWHYSMDELNMAASVVMFYVTLLPTFLWFLFWFRGCAKYYTLTETICAYGYSLSIFIPLAALFMVQATVFRYLVLIVASLLSGIVLTMSFLPVIQSDTSKGASHIILFIVPGCQLGLAYIMHRIMMQ